MHDTFMVTVVRHRPHRDWVQDDITVVTPTGRVEHFKVCNTLETVEQTMWVRLRSAFPTRKWHGERLVWSHLVDAEDLPSPYASMFAFEVDCDPIKAGV